MRSWMRTGNLDLEAVPSDAILTPGGLEAVVDYMAWRGVATP